MLTIEGYRISDQLSHVGRNAVYRATRLADNRPLILKTVDDSNLSLRDRARLGHEYEIGKLLGGEGTAVYESMIKVGHKLVLAIEDFDAITLRQWMLTPRSLEIKLQVAIQIAHQLHKVHAKGIVHKDVKPDNILINAETEDVRFIDFGLAVRLLGHGQAGSSANAAEGSIRYIPPEQTGRVNLSIDFRSDLYSLGVCLFELFSGHLPFPQEDLNELVYAHIAKRPPSLLTYSPDLPDSMDQVVQKLLQKSPEKRYQSAAGLLHDLQQCLEILRGKADAPAFKLGEKDFSGRFSLSRTLVGREEEIATLEEAFSRSVANGKELALIAGAPGAGKSALVRELLPTVAREKGILIEGKFDAQRTGTPYVGIAAALRAFTDLLLQRSEGELAHWRATIRDTVGGLQRVLTDLVPELGLVLGDHPELPTVQQDEAQARFDMAMRGFFSTVASASHPLVLFLDDLQWADAASVRLIESLLRDSEIRHLLIIGAYRDAEVGDTHPLRQSMERIGRFFTCYQISLRPLATEAVASLLSNSFSSHTGNVEEFAAVVQHKTGGNPFFIYELLDSLYERGVFEWDSKRLAWNWNLSALQRAEFTHNVVDYLCERVQRLDAQLMKMLKLASCIGNQFSVAVLASLTGHTPQQVASVLEEAMFQNLIIPAVHDLSLLTTGADALEWEGISIHGMEFVHDRVREAIYSLIGETERAGYHLEIGQAAIAHLDESGLEDNLFELVTHLNIGAAHITDPLQRKRLAHLNLRAGKKAKFAAAFSLAMRFVEAGIALLAPDAWHSDYATALGLHTERCSLLFLLEDAHAAEAAFDVLDGQARSKLDRLVLYGLRIQLLIHAGEFHKCRTLGILGSAMYGINIPESASALKRGILVEVIRAKFKIGRKKEEALLRMPMVQDPEMKALIEFLATFAMSVSVYFADLFAYAVVRGLRLTLKHGMADPFISYFHYYGLINLMAFGDYKSAYKYSSMSLKQFDLYPSVSYRERSEFGFLGWIAHWVDDVRPTVEKYQHCYNRAMEYGDLTIADWSANQKMWTMSVLGYPLSQIDGECKHQLALLQERSQDQSTYILEAVNRAGHCLMGRNEVPWSLDAPDFSFQSIQGVMQEKGALNVLAGLYSKRMFLMYLFDRHEEALAIMEEARPCADKLVNMFIQYEYYLFESLVILRLMEQGTYAGRADLKRQLSKNLKRFSTWSKRCPVNFSLFHHMVRAEQHRLEGNDASAQQHYEWAIQTASEKGWLHLEGVANELIARYYLLQGRPQVARAYLEEARQAYGEWGALRKVSFMEDLYQGVLPRLSPTTGSSSGSLDATSGPISAELDLGSMLKSSQAISGQIKLEALLKELLRILIENAGAERGYFLLNHDNRLLIKARGEAGLKSPEVLDSQPAFGNEHLPESVLHYVDHKREALILDHASTDHRFTADPYFKAHPTLSVMCFPVIKEGRLRAILYLENNQAPGVFTPDRKQMLDLLSGQIAVSIDNALVYENLEQLVEERTEEIRRQKDQIALQNEELAKEQRKSDELLRNILPKEIAEELKATGKAQARKFAQATVMFTDIVGFTKIAESLSPEELVRELDLCFSAFDAILRKYHLEKVKTIGDAYMCMAGVPVPKENSPVMAVLAGLEMQAFMAGIASKRKGFGAGFFEMRLGMHTGEIVAGVVGTEKFAYDIWGDTVNLAARLESAGESGKVNISEETYQLVKDHFECTHRGLISVKNKADVKMYFVTGLKLPARQLLESLSATS